MDDVPAIFERLAINPTPQRLRVARAVLSARRHLSADEIYAEVNAGGYQVSKATVYNTLGLFAKKGLIREVTVDPARVVYDPNVMPHHHFYNVVTGEIRDIAGTGIEVSGLPGAPEGTEVSGLEVIVRVRPSSTGS